MQYKLFIKRLEPNEHYEDELKEYNEERAGFNRNFEPNRPVRYHESVSLETILTEEEFKTIKKAVLTEFK